MTSGKPFYKLITLNPTQSTCLLVMGYVHIGWRDLRLNIAASNYWVLRYTLRKIPLGSKNIITQKKQQQILNRKEKKNTTNIVEQHLQWLCRGLYDVLAKQYTLAN
ncbi:hypothetical protein XELAEV_18009779mg [Xenopus laevis]|uniref:Uncharacterized protein n=1 Tax=Xenopus laevis TaxID=8355 RepID=A0A974DV45_XENLA|nr:hypothetical protein XELAEV_18009779mg [Xenopus laevis]